MSKSFTRVLVLAGIVTLANARGTASAGPSELAWARQDEAPSKEVVRANSSFGIDLYQRLAASNPGENLFVSPYSIASVLAMASEGARGRTALEMGRALHLPDSAKRTGDDAQRIPWETAKLRLGMAALNRMFNREDTPEQKELRKRVDALNEDLKQTRTKMFVAQGKKEWREYNEHSKQERKQVDEVNALLVKIAAYELSVANAIWGEKAYPFEPEFVRTVGESYGAGTVKNADFSGNADGERRAINAWAAKQTHDRIKDVLPEGSITELTRMVLVNAIYFKGEWVTPFIPGNTRKQDFTLADGTKASHPMMNAAGLETGRYAAFNADGSFFETPIEIERDQKDGLYPAAGGFALAELPYRGDAVSMVVLVPDSHDGLAALEKSLTADALDKWISRMKSREVNVALPKFRTESALSLKETLQAMGMAAAFSSDADFSGMTKAEKLSISDVFHKTFVDVNEKGTEAAAVTGMPAAGARVPDKIPFTPTIRADRPYLYVIRDVKEGTILFMGRFVKP